MRPRRLRIRSLALSALTLALSAGCEEPRHVAGPRPATAPQPPVPPPAPKPQDTFIVGQRTQDIRDARPEAQKGAHAAETRITARDPITLVGNAYVTSVGRIAVDNIKHAMDLYQAGNDGRLPKDYDEFMNEIIKPNNIALPRLPHYQKYAYDEKEHKLIVLEYPDLKNQPPQ